MNDMISTDIVIIGAGHNGLTCAAYLARAGRRVMVLEASDRVGGAAATREFAPGFSVSACAHLDYQLNPKVVKELELRRYGLQWAATHLDTFGLSASGDHLRISGRGLGATGAGVTASDQQALRHFNNRMRRFARLLLPVFDTKPPRLANNNWRDKLVLAKLGLSIRMLGREDMQEFLRVAAINIYDVLHETFENELLKGAIAFDAVLGTHMGPRSPNSVMTYLYRLTGLCRDGSNGLAQPLGGMGTISQALLSAAETAGATIKKNSVVARILLDQDRVAGVELAGGETIRAGTVISNADPRTTLFKLLGADKLEAGFARYVNNIRMKGCVAKLNLALDALPEFNGLDTQALSHRLLIAPTMQYLESGFDHCKYGELPPSPAIEIHIPTLKDSALAPNGKHVLSAIIQYAPHTIRSGWERNAESFKEHVIGTIAQYAPNLRNHIVAAQFHSPTDLEREYGMTGGHWHHGELSLDQLLMVRPAPGAAQYAMPIPGLYLCGAGAHPGGGVMGSVGRNAAAAVLAGA